MVAAGLTGYDGEDLGVPLVVTNDAVTAHLGALGGEPGAVIVAGTGAIALAATPEGWARADGWGTMLGDDGGGYWIGRRALAMALRDARRPRRRRAARRRRRRGAQRAAARRGGRRRGGRRRGGAAAAVPIRGGASRHGAAPLVSRAAAEARFGPLAQIARAVYDAPDPVATVAAFTRDVADLARGGDEAAAAIFAAAGRELAHGTAATRAPVAPGRRSAAPRRPVVVSWSGGVFAAGELILDPLRAHLPAGVELRAPLGDGLDGAARLLERPTAVPRPDPRTSP